MSPIWRSGLFFLESLEGKKKRKQSIRENLNQFAMKDVFNMDETRLFYGLLTNYSLATKHFEWKENKIRKAYSCYLLQRGWFIKIFFYGLLGSKLCHVVSRM